MQQAVGYIYRNVFSEISMQEIANRLGIKQPQLTRRFQAAYGVVPVELVTRLRLEEAKKLLLQTDDTLEAIALRCGYENGSYLSRIFRTKIGTSPSLFSKKLSCLSFSPLSEPVFIAPKRKLIKKLPHVSAAF
ncbi:helix-turn-helix domain-containing protein [Paenibacillus sp. LMG 31460]|uniref:Helix-turn-helix domain-containing protein n=1 Tax=Paenibacillus germinis TaxID=2654979 RepID=A0ABX1ZD13_9BACL|nr:AraC family transcriptional regulator [Paenibacillus germinis]NOU90124.1 helix-turn-helix domain-containing protein [Paenibacillus germinis]